MTYSDGLSKSFQRIAASVSFTAMLLAASTSVHAGKITAWTWSPTGIASVALDPVPPISDINNDAVAGMSPNTLLVTQKAIFSIGPVDIEFTVEDSGGVTEYSIIEGPSNGTGVPWSSYRLELGFGIESAFVLSGPGDGLDFDALDFNSPPDFSGSGFFTTVAESEDVLLASGGIFPVFGFPTPEYRFNIDVPDGITSFTIRQQPIGVPEPASVSLLAMLGLGAMTYRRRRKSGHAIL